MRRVFLSDVHLSPLWPERSQRLVRFLEHEAPRTDELYILGDLFDYWIGPKHLRLPHYREALEALGQVVRRGVRVVLLKGNRDFYMTGFAERTGIHVAPGGTEHRLTVGARQVYLCHGDYLEGREGLGFAIQEWIRSPGFERGFIRLPARVADALARFYRRVSGRKDRRPKTKALHLGPYGLCEEPLMAEFRRGTDIVVCGHVHEAQEVPFEVDGRGTRLFTLGDWSGGESYLVEEDGKWVLCAE